MAYPVTLSVATAIKSAPCLLSDNRRTCRHNRLECHVIKGNIKSLLSRKTTSQQDLHSRRTAQGSDLTKARSNGLICLIPVSLYITVPVHHGYRTRSAVVFQVLLAQYLAGWCVKDSDLDVRSLSLSIYNLVVEAEIVFDAGTCSEVLRDHRVIIESVIARELRSTGAATISRTDVGDGTTRIVRCRNPRSRGHTWVAVAFEAAIDHWVDLTALNRGRGGYGGCLRRMRLVEERLMDAI